MHQYHQRKRRAGPAIESEPRCATDDEDPESCVQINVSSCLLGKRVSGKGGAHLR